MAVGISNEQGATVQTSIFASVWSVAPPGFCNRGGSEVWSIGGLEYEVPQSRLYCLRINVALCSTALQCICRVIRRSFMTMKVHTYYIIVGRPPIGGSFPLPPLAAPLRVRVTTTAPQKPKVILIDQSRGKGDPNPNARQCDR